MLNEEELLFLLEVNPSQVIGIDVISTNQELKAFIKFLRGLENRPTEFMFGEVVEFNYDSAVIEIEVRNNEQVYKVCQLLIEHSETFKIKSLDFSMASPIGYWLGQKKFVLKAMATTVMDTLEKFVK